MEDVVWPGWRERTSSSRAQIIGENTWTGTVRSSGVAASLHG